MNGPVQSGHTATAARSIAAQPVAVVGMGVLFPGAADLDAFWRNITEGVDSITDVPDGYGLPGELFPGARGGFLGELAAVDALGMGVMPAALPYTEPDQLIALHVASAALADAGGAPADPDRVGVIFGRGGYITAGLARIDLRVRVAHQLAVSLRELLPELDDAALEQVRERFVTELGPPSRGAEIGLVPNLAASRVANRLGFGGPAYTVDAACASSLIAVEHAVAELAGGRCDLVLAGGVHHAHDVTLWSVFDRLGALSRRGRIQPFDADADGLVIGEGTGVVALKRLDDARRSGDRVYAVIRGTGVASDGGGVSLMHPASAGQVRAVRRAWAAAGLDPAAPDSVGLVEAHGTATPAGDAAELATLLAVFGPGRQAVIGSVKSMIGHTMPAAGIAGLIKAALAVHHGVLPPTLHCVTPHPDLAHTRFRPIDRARPWTGGGPRRAAVNAFGFGGISAHVILEQPPDASRAPRALVLREPVRVQRLAADSPRELLELLDAGAERTVGRCRLAVVEPTPKKLATARRAIAADQPWRGRNDIWFSPRPLLPEHQIAFVHPGLEAEFSPQVDDVAARFGLPMPDLTAHTLGRHGAALIAVSRLLGTALRGQGVRPDALAGHSIGEWTAMITAGMCDDAELAEVIAATDLDAIQVPDLVFATVGAPAERIEPLLTGDITLSHDNAPNQCVVCGPADQVRALLDHLLADRVFGQVLPFRSGFHTPRLRPYLDPFRRAVDRMALKPPAVPVWSATAMAPFPADDDQVRDLYFRHLLEPVRFRGMIERMHAAGVRVFVQVGPGQLSTLISDVLHGREHLTVAAASARTSGLGQLTRVIAAIWAEGGTVAEELIAPRPVADAAHGRGLVRLGLGGPIVRLGADAPDLIGARTPPRPVPQPHRSDATGLSTDVPPPLRELLADTERAMLDVLTAAGARGAPSRAVVLKPIRTAAARAAAPSPSRTTREMSLRTQPHLRDHAFVEIPAGWPDDYDGFPVVPATELLRQMMEFAERAVPGTVAVAARDVRFLRWLAVEPPVTVAFETVPLDRHRVRIVVQGYAQAEIELAPGYPPAPPPWPAPPVERRPLLSGEQMYQQRWMFHGPEYQGVSEIGGIGDRHVHGVITTPAAPGSLLDNAGHFVGYWTLEELQRNSRTFPERFGELRFYATAPTAGERVRCLAFIEEVTDAAVIARLQLVREDGTVWAQVHGWQLHRFASDDRIRAVERFGGTALLGERQEGGWFLVREAWSDLASRELIARSYLTRDEWAEYEGRPPRDRRPWLLGLLACKDAVRAVLLGTDRPSVFPKELTAAEDADGTPRVIGRHGLQLPALDVAVAYSGTVGVALVRPAGGAGGAGIAVLEIGPDPDDTRRQAMAAALNQAEGRTGPAGTGSRPVRTATLSDGDSEYVVAWTDVQATGKDSS